MSDEEQDYGDEEQPQEEEDYGGGDEPAEEEDAGGYEEPAEEEDAGGYEQPAEEEKDEPAEEPEEDDAPASYGSAPSGLDVDSAWREICKDEPKINWYCCDIDKKIKMTLLQAGTGGLKELKQLLSSSKDRLMLGLLRVNSKDRGGSKRAKFIFIRFVGSGVKVMHKAKLTPQSGKLAESFPVKHMTIDLTEELGKQMDMETLAKEFLRVGGAHKPDAYEFGPGQTYNLKK